MNGLYNICWMAVEPHYAADVQELLQSMRARDGVGEPSDQADDGAAPAAAGGGRRRNNGGGVVWLDEEYDAFMAAGKESYRRVRLFCDVLASAPGQLQTTSAASTTAGVTPSQLRAALGKFSIWMGATVNNKEWPFGWAFGEDVDPNNPAEFHYTMSEEQAAAWQGAKHRRG